MKKTVKKDRKKASRIVLKNSRKFQKIFQKNYKKISQTNCLFHELPGRVKIVIVYT